MPQVPSFGLRQNFVRKNIINDNQGVEKLNAKRSTQIALPTLLWIAQATTYEARR